jgi:hypothetical protein
MKKLGFWQLLALILIGVIAFYYLPGFLGAIFPTTPTQPYTPSGPFQNYNIGFTYQETNALSGSAESTTSPSYIVYHSNGRRLSSINSLYGEQGVAIASGTTATNFAVLQTDGDYLFINIDTGTGHYPDVAKIMSSNPAFVSYKWIPVSSATVGELVVELQISKLGAPNYNVNPSISTKLLISCVPNDVSVTMSSPADQTSLGVSQTDVYITWQLTGLTANQGFAFARIYVTSNQTASDLECLDLTITSSSYIVNMQTATNVGSTYLIPTASATSTTTGGVVQFWRYFPFNRDQASEYSQALLIPRGSSDADVIYVRLHARVTLRTAGHGVTCVLGVALISAGNSVQTAVTDSVTLSA